MHSLALLCVGMYGDVLPNQDGAPVRMVIPWKYGYKSIKWLSEIQLVDAVEPGYWEGYGYAIDGWVGKSNGRDDAPTA